jgi:hypothetical protein
MPVFTGTRPVAWFGLGAALEGMEHVQRRDERLEVARMRRLEAAMAVRYAWNLLAHMKGPMTTAVCRHTAVVMHAGQTSI